VDQGTYYTFPFIFADKHNQLIRNNEGDEIRGLHGTFSIEPKPKEPKPNSRA
jgi:hypothetical protein